MRIKMVWRKSEAFHLQAQNAYSHLHMYSIFVWKSFFKKTQHIINTIATLVRPFLKLSWFSVIFAILSFEDILETKYLTCKSLFSPR